MNGLAANLQDGKAKAQFPAKAGVLFKPAPYKVFHGGRSATKTWDFCTALLILGSHRKLFILCAREIQKSIAESVHKALSDRIDALGLGHFYRVLTNKIIGLNGTEIVFAGIRNNISSIKSMEGIDICAVFEATFVSEHSWNVLLPTVRRDPPYGPFGKGSEVWVEFNPELASDYTWKFWVLDPPAGTVVVQINWRDNPWFSEFSRKQKNDLRKRDYDSYLTVWEGRIRRVLQGAIYAKQLEAAQRDGRISPQVLVDRALPVDVSADLGRGDLTSLTFWQQTGMQHAAIDYYGNFGFDWSHYLEQIQHRRYVIRRIFLPHDAENKVLQASKSIKRQTQDAYPGEGRVITVPRTDSVANDINAVRMMFPRMFFNEKTCSDLLTGLAHYRYEVDPETKEVSDKPDHNWACMTAETRVLTREGTKRISDLPKQGEVLTPCGWKRYYNPRITRRNAPLVEITFADGLRVNCTAEHLFLTASGWKSAGSLQKGSRILSSLTLSRSISTANSIGFGLVARTFLAEAATCISMFGNLSSASVLRVFTSIIGMIIAPITGLRTSNVCLKTNTIGSRRLAEWQMERIRQSVIKQGSPLPLGTVPRKGDFGIVATLNAVRLGKSGSGNRELAQTVKRLLTRLFAKMVTPKNGVPSVAKSALMFADVRPLNRTEDVWCLSVPNGNWWSLENGAVVHNSHPADSVRCYVMGQRTISVPAPQKHGLRDLPAYTGGGTGWMNG